MFLIGGFQNLGIAQVSFPNHVFNPHVPVRIGKARIIVGDHHSDLKGDVSHLTSFRHFSKFDVKGRFGSPS